MKYSIVYNSKTGNTAILAEKIKEKITAESCVYFGVPSQEALAADTIFIGFWTDKGRCDDNLKTFIESLENKNIVLFGTAGFGGSEAYFNQIISRIAAVIPNSCTLKASFMCQGKMPFIVRERYTKALENDPDNSQMKSMIENFDRALTHPDTNDLENLSIWIDSILK